MLPTAVPNRNQPARPERDPEAERWIAALLGGERRDGAGGRVRVHPSMKRVGAHWRLVSLAELGVTITTPGAEPALEEAAARRHVARRIRGSDEVRAGYSKRKLAATRAS